jgi:hypothetical protein
MHLTLCVDWKESVKREIKEQRHREILRQSLREIFKLSSKTTEETKTANSLLHSNKDVKKL